MDESVLVIFLMKQMPKPCFSRLSVFRVRLQFAQTKKLERLKFKIQNQKNDSEVLTAKYANEEQEGTEIAWTKSTASLFHGGRGGINRAPDRI
jgi:hypothetical protein